MLAARCAQAPGIGNGCTRARGNSESKTLFANYAPHARRSRASHADDCVVVCGFVKLSRSEVHPMLSSTTILRRAVPAALIAFGLAVGASALAAPPGPPGPPGPPIDKTNTFQVRTLVSDGGVPAEHQPSDDAPQEQLGRRIQSQRLCLGGEQPHGHVHAVRRQWKFIGGALRTAGIGSTSCRDDPAAPPDRDSGRRRESCSTARMTSW